MSRTMTALFLALAACGASASFAADTAKKEPAAKTAGATHLASAHTAHKAKKGHHAAIKVKPRAAGKAAK
jgi:hypothetical protein